MFEVLGSGLLGLQTRLMIRGPFKNRGRNGIDSIMCTNEGL